MSEINVTPLVDVMLVLLIIFLITIPVVTTSVKVDLPNEVQQPRETKPDNIILSINARGQAFLFDTPLRNQAEMVKQLQTLADKKPQGWVMSWYRRIGKQHTVRGLPSRAFA